MPSESPEQLKQRHAADIKHIKDRIAAAQIDVLADVTYGLHLRITVRFTASSPLIKFLHIDRLPYIAAVVDDDLPNLHAYIDAWIDEVWKDITGKTCGCDDGFFQSTPGGRHQACQRCNPEGIERGC